MSLQSYPVSNMALRTSCTKSPTEALIDTTVRIIEYIWSGEPVDPRALPLRIFVQEVLRRSGASFSTLLVTLVYLFRFKSCSNLENIQAKCHSLHHRKACGSGRRMFVAAIITASKYLEDRSFPNTRWARITGLNVQEINSNERIFLELLNYRLYITPSLFTWWMMLLFGNIDSEVISFPNEKTSEVRVSTIQPAQSDQHFYGPSKTHSHLNHPRFLPYQNQRVRTFV